MSNRGYFGIGILEPKKEQNVGTLWRSAHIFGASFIYTIGKRYKLQASDTTKAYRSIPFYYYPTFENFYANLPQDSSLIGIELDDKAVPIKNFVYPDRTVFLLGNETRGIPQEYLNKCHKILQLPGKFCMNLSVAGSIVLFDRHNKNV